MVHEAFCLDSQGAYLWGVDDFIGDSIDARWNATGSAGGSAVVVDAQDGGICRITTDGDTNDAWRIDWGDIRSLLVSKKITMETRIKTTQTASFFYDIKLRNVAAEQFGFFYNSAASANVYIYERTAAGQNGVDSGVILDTDYHIYKVEAFPTGEIHFYIDDVETLNSPRTTYITSTHLQPYINATTLENATKSMDIDYVQWRQDR